MAANTKKIITLGGLCLIILISLACKSVTVNIGEPSSTVAPSDTPVPPTITPSYTSESTSTETLTLTIAPPRKTATKIPTRAIPTRTVPPPTLTQAVIQQAVIPEQPTSRASSSGEITVTAATGNLFIRRGPGTIYNIVSGLSKGTTTKAVGRNEKNDWLAIEIPKANGVIGWISMGTGFTEMNGSIQSLPLYPFDEAKPAYLMNCTDHDMTTSPGQWNLPANTTQKVNPGEYNILDMSTGQSKVQEVDLKEGNTVSIKKDGNGASYTCP
ncbi:MAG: SH3 domain-containing protein [Leptolinea sp.]|jgi:hypothetical protein|nr:SH3 domain-containing protein [Leptolinea sp.]